MKNNSLLNNKKVHFYLEISYAFFSSLLMQTLRTVFPPFQPSVA